MEKRFEIFSGVYVGMIKDNQTGEVYVGHQAGPLVDLLNKQNEKIKELEKANKEFKQIMEKHNIIGLIKLDACLADYLNVNEDTMSGKIIKQQKEKIKKLDSELAELNRENESYKDLYEQLKQSQNSKAIEVLEKLKPILFDSSVAIDYFEHRAVKFSKIYEIINNQINELKDLK